VAIFGALSPHPKIPFPAASLDASQFIAATNALTMTRRNTATEPRFKREDGCSFQLPPPPACG
jgi:hypothetical protein